MINISNKDGDESVGRQTFAVSFGIKTTSILAFFLCLVSFLMGLFLSEPLSSVSSLSALPFFIFLIFRGKTKDILRSIRYSIFLLNFYVLTIYPLLFFPVIISYYLAKYYYWHRFSIHYPTLLVENDWYKRKCMWFLWCMCFCVPPWLYRGQGIKYNNR